MSEKVTVHLVKWKTTGRNASLNIKANAGKSFVNLSEELEYPAGGVHPQHGSHNHGSKNGPARQRRRTRRAAACEAGKAVSCAEKETGDEKVDDIAKKKPTVMNLQ